MNQDMAIKRARNLVESGQAGMEPVHVIKRRGQYLTWFGPMRLGDEAIATYAISVLPAGVPEPTPSCLWFALCDNDADTTRAHPMMGDVPVCKRCDDKVEAL